jgi:hypothetical protein
MRPAHLESRPELADVGRLARRLLRRAVAAARTEDAPVQRALWEHLGPQAADVPVVRAAWPGYDWVNVQVGVDAWLAGPGRWTRGGQAARPVAGWDCAYPSSVGTMRPAHLESRPELADDGGCGPSRPGAC